MAEVSPELAGKVLDADVRNIIQKVQDNRPLNAGERELFQQFAVEREQLHQVRQAALVRKWLKGARLTQSEVAEISEIVPSAREHEVTGYSRSLRSIAELYVMEGEKADVDSIVRSLKRWTKSGREAGNLPPLEAPEEMPSWWSVVMQRRPPQRIREAAERACPAPAKAETTGAAPQAANVLPPAPVVSAGALPPVEDESGGLASALSRMQREERAAYARYLAAQQPDADGAVNQGAVKVALTMWNDIVENLRKLENSAYAAGERAGELLPKSAVREAILEIHSNIAAGVRSAFRRCRPKMPGIDMTRSREQDAVFDAEVDALFLDFRNSQFAAQLSLE